jgi:thiol-disulfide isomerase/thioredoxin
VTDRPAFTHQPPKRGVIGPFTGRQLAITAGTVVVAIVVLVGVTTPLGSTNAGPPGPLASQYIFAPPTEGLHVGALAPEFAVTDTTTGATYPLTDLEGHPISLASLRGKAVWVNFWASWCPPCQQETPTLREVSDLYRDRGLVLVAVDVQETADGGRRYAERYGLRYTIGADVSGRAFHVYHVYGLPTQFFIGPDGVIRSVVQGPLTREAAIANVEAILPSATPSAAPSALRSVAPSGSTAPSPAR